MFNEFYLIFSYIWFAKFYTHGIFFSFFFIDRSCRIAWKAIVVQYGCLPWHLHVPQLYLFFCIVPRCLAGEIKIAYSAIYAIPGTRLFYCLLNN